MHQCCVFGCRNEGRHSFPKDICIRAVWEAAIRSSSSKDFRVKKHSKICSAHFKSDDYIKIGKFSGLHNRLRTLKKGTVPSIFPCTENDGMKLNHRLGSVEADCEKLSSNPIQQCHTYAPDPYITICNTTSDMVAFCSGVDHVIPKGLNDTLNMREKGKETSIVSTTTDGDNMKSINRHKCGEADESKLNFSYIEKWHDYACDPNTILATSSEMVVFDTIDCVEEVIANENNDLPLMQNAKSTLCENATQKNFQFYTIESFRNDDKGIAFYTGLESFHKFMFVFNTLCPEAYSLTYKRSQVLGLSVEDQFLLSLMKLRRNKEDFELSRFFDVSPCTVSNIFITWVNFMHQMWSMLNIWPERALIDFYMPEDFKKYYPSTRVIVDCTEIPIQRPANPAAQRAVWSTYKNRSTVKYEVGASPSGLITHCSDAYAGSTSDRQIVERSSLYVKCEEGDSVMADRGFNVQDIFAHKGIGVNIPSFLKGKSQLPGMTVLKDRRLSSKRIHIERLIGLTKTYCILQKPVNSYYVPLMSKIFFVCVMLCNFRENILKSTA